MLRPVSLLSALAGAVTAGVLLVTLILFGFYKMSLGSGVGRMEQLAAQGRS